MNVNSSSLPSSSLRRKNKSSSSAAGGAGGAVALLARVEITGEDYFLNANHATSQKFHAIRNEHVKANRLFEDADFPANAASIDGEDNSAAASSSSSSANNNNNNNNNTTSLVTPKCMCGVDAKRAVVSRDTPNKGRPYYACANTSKKCGFFTWADGTRYEGNWDNGLKSGHGVQTWPDGFRYVRRRGRGRPRGRRRGRPRTSRA